VRKVAGAAIGTVGGFIAGGVIGAQRAPDCRCHTPGILGFIIGAPVGAVIGGILGFNFF
jgi:hypothetical protein